MFPWPLGNNRSPKGFDCCLAATATLHLAEGGAVPLVSAAVRAARRGARLAITGRRGRLTIRRRRRGRLVVTARLALLLLLVRFLLALVVVGGHDNDDDDNDDQNQDQRNTNDQSVRHFALFEFFQIFSKLFVQSPEFYRLGVSDAAGGKFSCS